MSKTIAIVPWHFQHSCPLVLPGTEIPYGSLGERLGALCKLQPAVVVSGDCMAALAVHRSHLPLVWYDAHGDFNDECTSRTGSIGGMPLAMICGLGPQGLVSTPVQPERCYHVGGTEFDPGEEERMIASGVHVCERVPMMIGPIHLHLDLDVVRQRDLPGSRHPSPNGMLLVDFYRAILPLLAQTEVLSIKSPPDVTVASYIIEHWGR